MRAHKTDEENIKNTRKRKSLVRTFLTVFLSMMFIFAAFVSVGVAYLYYAKGINPADSAQGLISGIGFKAPLRTNFIIFGLDKSNARTDFIMAGSFNSDTNKLSLISIPRDTYVKIPKERLDILKQNGKTVPEVMKITEVHSRVGSDFGTEFAVKQVEELLSVHMDYYVEVDFDAFQYIIDSIGGIDVYVPQDMYYNDPVQDLRIDLKEGRQTLTGEQAEGLVRFRQDPSGRTRSYPMADLDRIKVQQMFISEFFSQALSKDAVTKNAAVYLSALSKYVNTNIGVSEAAKYIKYLEGFTADNIITYTLPGNPKNIGGVSYFIENEAESSEVVYEIFIKDSNAPVETSMDKGIIILNGGYVSGLAKEKQDMMERDGFTVVAIGDSKEEKTPHTRIFVRREGWGQDLQKYFGNSKVIVDTEATEEAEIIVIIGTDEQKLE